MIPGVGARSSAYGLHYNWTSELPGWPVTNQLHTAVLMVTAQATSSTHVDESFLVRGSLVWNGHQLIGFDMVVARADASGKADWKQPLQLNWMLAVLDPSIELSQSSGLV